MIKIFKVSPPVRLCVCPSVCLSVCPYVHMSVCPSVRLSVIVSACPCPCPFYAGLARCRIENIQALQHTPCNICNENILTISPLEKHKKNVACPDVDCGPS